MGGGVLFSKRLDFENAQNVKRGRNIKTQGWPSM